MNAACTSLSPNGWPAISSSNVPTSGGFCRPIVTTCRSRRARHETTFRSITVDGQEIEFSEGFSDLHTAIYARTLAGHGFGIDDARPSIELAYRIRQAAVVAPRGGVVHPVLERS